MQNRFHLKTPQFRTSFQAHATSRKISRKSTTIVHETSSATQMREKLITSIDEAKNGKDDMAKANTSLRTVSSAIIRHFAPQKNI